MPFLQLDTTLLAAAAYNAYLAPQEVQLVFTDSILTGQYNPGNVTAKFQLLQNRPNPFSDETVIGFILPEACDAQLQVLDVSGREILHIDKLYPAGYNEEMINLGELTSAGMLYYELTTPYGKLTKKMTLLWLSRTRNCRISSEVLVATEFGKPKCVPIGVIPEWEPPTSTLSPSAVSPPARVLYCCAIFQEVVWHGLFGRF